MPWWARVLRLTAVTVAVILALRVGGCTDRLFFVPTREATPPPAEFAGARAVRFESSDRTPLCGWFIPAQTGAGGAGKALRAPTVLHLHGNAGSMVSHIGFTHWLPGEGFNLFMIDYRGYGESGGSATSRQALLADASAGLDALLRQPEVDPARVGLFAQSLGGAIGVTLMSRRPEIRAAVLESPFASWRLAAATAIGGSDPNWFVRALAALVIGDDERPMDAMATVRAPVLIIHGAADTIVPILHGRLLRDAAPDRVELLEFSGGEHNSLQETHPEARRAVRDFFRRALTNDAQADGVP